MKIKYLAKTSLASASYPQAKNGQKHTRQNQFGESLASWRVGANSPTKPLATLAKISPDDTSPNTAPDPRRRPRRQTRHPLGWRVARRAPIRRRVQP